jgi:hypothetical protein
MKMDQATIALAIRVQQAALNNNGTSKTQLLIGDLWREIVRLHDEIEEQRDFELTSLQQAMDEASYKELLVCTKIPRDRKYIPR